MKRITITSGRRKVNLLWAEIYNLFTKSYGRTNKKLDKRLREIDRLKSIIELF